MACVPLSVERCVVLRATSGSFLDAAMAKIGQDGSPPKIHIKNKEKKPHDLRFCPSHTRARTHTHTEPQSNLFPCTRQSPCVMW